MSPAAARLRFQVNLGGDWQDFSFEEDQALKRASVDGRTTVRFTSRGQSYECDLTRLEQRNLLSGRSRPIRPPTPPAEQATIPDSGAATRRSSSRRRVDGEIAAIEVSPGHHATRRGDGGGPLRSVRSMFSFGRRRVTPDPSLATSKGNAQISCALKTVGATVGAGVLLASGAVVGDEFLANGELGIADGFMDGVDSMAEGVREGADSADKFISDLF